MTKMIISHSISGIKAEDCGQHLARETLLVRILLKGVLASEVQQERRRLKMQRKMLPIALCRLFSECQGSNVFRRQRLNLRRGGVSWFGIRGQDQLTG